uniref:Sodium/hydrogen exchanger n=1 Tax=Schmidtea mediterranea TaxID=79327 RepID=A0A0H3YF72_SCHMD|nr:slc9a-4 [Schmidtea mediterranea]
MQLVMDRYRQCSNLFLVFVGICFCILAQSESVASSVIVNNSISAPGNHSNGSRHSETFKVIDWKFDKLKNYIIYCLFIIVVILMKIGYHHMPRLSKFVPESCLLLIVGILFGVIIKFLLKKENVVYFKLTPDLFFCVLLPPIILESSYSLYHKNFMDNLLAILIFAIFGTLFNFLIIGFALFGFTQIGLMKKLKLSLLHCLLFSSLIVAVDPVAVLAIFNDVGVNEDLYYLVFGESLLNDAVCVVLYEMMQEFALMSEIGTKNIILGVISFFTVSLGGMVIGIIVGVLSCLMVRIMGDRNTVFLEPVILISMGYFSYLIGNLFGWSGIISIITCGLIQVAYAVPGMKDSSNLVLKRFVKVLASICEPIIFLFLGVEIVIGDHSWEISFIMCALILCMAARFIVIFGLSGIINFIHVNMRNIPMQEKFIIAYGGLRGAVAFSLAVLIDDKIFESSEVSKNTIVSTTLIIILFTIIIQGMTVKPLVKCLQITKINKDSNFSLFKELNESLLESTSKGIQGIIGNCGRYYLLMITENFSNKYIRPFLQGKEYRNRGKIFEVNAKINSIMLASINNDPSLKSQFHRIPNSYKNLLTIRENPQLKIEEPAVRKRPMIRHSMSDVTGHPSNKPLKHLSKFLYRASAINTEEDEVCFTNSIRMNTFDYVPVVMKAKDKFLGSLQKKKPSVIEEETSLITSCPTCEEKLVFKDAANVNCDDEERLNFY